MSVDVTQPLHDRVVVVTGVTGATGTALIPLLTAAGAFVIGVGRDSERLRNVGEQLGTDGTRFMTATADLARKDQCDRLFDEILHRHGRIDAVLHLVGGWKAGGVNAFTSDDLEHLHRRLVVTTANVTRAANRPLLASGGVFVNISSSATRTVAPNNAAYAAAKTAADVWVGALAQNLAANNGGCVTFDVKALDTQHDTPPREGWTAVKDLAAAIAQAIQLPPRTERIQLP